MEEVLITKEEIKELILEYIKEFVGDTAVVKQINKALKGHEHDCPTREEYEELKKMVEKIAFLVGDAPVVEQINKALQG